MATRLKEENARIRLVIKNLQSTKTHCMRLKDSYTEISSNPIFSEERYKKVAGELDKKSINKYAYPGIRIMPH